MPYARVVSFLKTLRKGRFFVLILMNVFMGIAVFSTVVSENPLRTNGEIQTPERKMASVISINDSENSSSFLDYKMITLDLECVKSGALDKISSGAKFVRIKGRVCGHWGTKVLKSQLFNRSNGYEATMFDLAKNHFTTDYMALNPGINKLLLKSELENGKTITAELSVNYLEAKR